LLLFHVYLPLGSLPSGSVHRHQDTSGLGDNSPCNERFPESNFIGDQKTGSRVITIEPLEDVRHGLPLEVFQTGQSGRR
ncbi:hypothetical protein, partial [Geobacter grbiciae]|uniref:hypothetical protein n=1 Tax=Geobacter grbiciae TaxID=155042 RepID=UPI001C0300E0